MRIRVLAADDLWQALPMVDAIAACREAFRALAEGTITAPPRAHLVDQQRTTLLMAASGGGAGRIAKVVNVFPGNAARSLETTTGLVMVLDPDTGHTRGLCDGGTLTAIRTGAAAGLATDMLARSDAAIGAVLGAGAQARTQVLAMDTVRALQEIRVYARRPDHLAAFVAAMTPLVSARLIAATSSDAAIDGAHVISAATSSPSPVFAGDRVRAGTHVNAVGSFRLAMQELDRRTIARAARIVVDLRAAALHEAGELVAAVAAGVTAPELWLELGELILDPSRGRAGDADITLFKSVGHAVQDLFAARQAIDNAERLGLGKNIHL